MNVIEKEPQYARTRGQQSEQLFLRTLMLKFVSLSFVYPWRYFVLITVFIIAFLSTNHNSMSRLISEIKIVIIKEGLK